MYHSIDDLLYEVNRVAKLPTVEDLREPVTRNLISVYKKVDAPSLWQGAVWHYELKGEPVIKQPAYCMMPMDMVSGKFDYHHFSIEGRFETPYQGLLVYDAQVGHSVSYKRSGDHLFISGVDKGASLSQYAPSGNVTLSYWRIPLDEQGAPLVDDRIWDAAKFYCQAEEARVALHGKNTQSFAGVPYQVDSQLAARAIDEARAFCNKLSPADWRTFWTKLQTNQPG